MKVFLHFSQSMYKSMYNCEVIVKDTAGQHNYFVNLVSMEADSFEFLEIEAASGDFVLTVLPQMADYKSMMAEAEIALEGQACKKNRKRNMFACRHYDASCGVYVQHIGCEEYGYDLFVRSGVCFW